MRYWTLILTIWTCVSLPAAAGAQVHQHSPGTADGLVLSFHGQAFLNANFQIRKFTDFYQLESQNWFMAEAERTKGRARFSAQAMVSLEAFTLRRLGSAQVFQTGETLDGAPLIDYQHPHDLFMGLEAGVSWRANETTTWWLRGGPVGSPALGPEAFMHRRSGMDNPTAPLSHHQLDSAHISRSVITMGVKHRSLSLDASAFKGREPDEDRLDLDLGVPDSWSARMRWSSAHWHAQVSGGHLREPEPNEPFDVTRITASVSHDRTIRGVPTALTIALGRNREFDGNHGAIMAEMSASPGRAGEHTLYWRAEFVEKNILRAGGLHPPGFIEPPAIISRIGAATVGYARTVRAAFAIGGDVTFYAVPPNLDDSYGNPLSVHVYLRWRAPTR